ncbi:MAG TPA: dihydrodipicolinate synthase family protein [Egicoccus sp.]|nr:dihydrodipicolinate synthase family protein [Egicoccus sp.]HSK25087.1 dihydrodipicolinate synthase family protein [Egicoccus sp.]
MSIPGLHGSLPALVTPLDASRAVHLGDVVTLVRRAVDDGASGVVVAGSTGEGALLEPAQRVALTRAAREVVDDMVAADGQQRPLVVAGASGPTVASVHADVARLAEAGADIALVLAPATYPLTPEELVGFHLAIAERAVVPTLVYHIPQFTGSALVPDTLPELAAHPRIVGMKDSSPDADRRAAFAAAAAGLDGFDVLTGHGSSLRSALEAGVVGSITAVANLRQRQVVRLHAAVTAGDTTEAERLQQAISRTSTAIGAVASSMQAVIKAALQLEGVLTERWCVAPLMSVPTGRLDQVRTALLA